MGDINDAIQMELFNDRRFMMGLAAKVAGLPYNTARVAAMDYIEDRMNAEYGNTVFGGPSLRTACWWMMSGINYLKLADEALERLGVR